MILVKLRQFQNNFKTSRRFLGINYENIKDIDSIHGKNKYWEIYMRKCSTFRYVHKLLVTGSTVLVQLDQQSWKISEVELHRSAYNDY